MAGLCALAASGHAGLPRPPAGTDVDETRLVSARPRMPAPCVAVLYEGATVVMSRRELEALATERPETVHGDADRLARVRSGRAAALLSTLEPPRSPGACAEVAGAALGAEGDQVVLDWLENGRAMVREPLQGQAVSTVRIRYLGQRCGPMCGRGDITVSLPEGARPFLAVSWWVS